MSSTFEIDSVAVTDPVSFAYEERFSPFKDATGQMVVSAYRAAVASFNHLTPAQFNLWCAADDELPHSIKCYAPDTNTLTTYSQVYIQYAGSEISTGLYYYGSEFRIRHIATLAAFGA